MSTPRIYDHLEGTEIAVIGMAGRFPKARNIDEFWLNLRDGVEGVTFFTDEELKAAGVGAATLADANFIKAAALLDGADHFDASFFGFNPREAEIMDPQHRVLLECAWEAIENAGYNTANYKGSIGVFAGATINTYLLLNIVPNSEVTNSLEDVQINIANGSDFLTTRISYKLDLKGPSHVVQSACSTSLLAVHLGCQSLLNEESDIVLAGGVSINVKLRRGYRYADGGMASPDGHCRAFDAKAQGTLFGSGAGIVVLKRVKDALADGDTIHALIKGSAVNNDGSAKVGYTAPSVEGQANVVTEALANAGVDADTITYIEAHGTGTPLGDPIEVQALTKAFTAENERRGFCALGSVKTNVGHLDAAAGVTGLIKTIEALKHKMLPPSLHFERANPQIDFENSPFYVNATLQEWKSEGAPRRAGVSAFGVGGTNVHVIVQEAPEAEATTQSRAWHLLLLSAKTAAALEEASSNLKDHLKQHPNVSIADVAYTLQIGRRHFSHRRVIVCRDLLDAVSNLEAPDPERSFDGYVKQDGKPVAFMFPGQGAQRLNMASEFYRDERVFREQVDRCSELLIPHIGFDLREVLYPAADRQEEAERQLDLTSTTQPALFVIEYALVQMWMSWGVKLAAMIGHSIGEYVTACLARVITLEDALRVVAIRGRLMQDTPRGAMISVGLSEEETRGLLAKGLSLAAVNSRFQCVVAGELEAVAELERRLAADGVSARRIRTSHAFHSGMMEQVVEPFTRVLESVELKPPQIPYISNVSGTWITEDEATDANYFARHLRQTVRFADGVRELLAAPDQLLLEAGPGQTLSRLVKRQIEGGNDRVSLATTKATDEHSDLELALATLGKLWAAGAQVEWESFYKDQKRRRIPLPTYPFERQRYWIEPQKETTRANRQTSLARRDIGEWFYLPSWKRSLGVVKKQTEENKAEGAEAGRGVWLVFGVEQGMAEEIERRLRQQAEEVITVRSGEGYRREGASNYVIEEGSEKDYERVIKDVEERGKRVERVVHLWSLSEREGQAERGKGNTHEEAFNREGFDRAQRKGFYSLLFLAKAFSNLSIHRPISIDVLSTNIHAITGNETVHPEKATMIAACIVISQEYPNLACKCIDILIPQQAEQQERLIEQLVAEVEAESSDPIIAYRGGQKWVRAFEPVTLAGHLGPDPFRKNGVYLLTGGLDGIGFALAEHLARTVQARLVLLEHAPSRHRSEARSDAPGHRGTNDAAHNESKLRTLRDLGAEVMLIQADLGDADRMCAVVSEAAERFGNLRGVIHAAAVAGEKSFRTIAETGEVECNWHFELKALALVALEKALHGRPLDFCILDSSLSSILGGIGYLAYASANSFLDAFVEQHNNHHATAWTSVNLDAWRHSEQKAQLANIGSDLAQLAMSAEEGIEVFRRILSAKVTGQIIVSTGDLKTRSDHLLKARLSRRINQSEQEGAASSLHPRPKLPNACVAPATELEQALAKIWQNALGIEQVGTTDNFFDLGGDSLLAVQVVAQLRKELDVEISAVSLYEGVTIKSVIELLGSRRQDEAPAQSGSQSEGREERALRRKQYQQELRSRNRAV